MVAVLLLEVELMEDGCNRTVKIVVEVSDPEDQPIVGAGVTIKLKHHQVEYLTFSISFLNKNRLKAYFLPDTVMVRLPIRASASGRLSTSPTALAWLRRRCSIT